MNGDNNECQAQATYGRTSSPSPRHLWLYRGQHTVTAKSGSEIAIEIKAGNPNGVKTSKRRNTRL